MSTSAQRIAKLAARLSEGFNKDALSRELHPLARKFAKAQSAFLQKQGIESATVELAASTKSLQKDQLTRACSLPFVSKPIFEAFLKSLPKDLATIWELLIWNECLGEADIEAQTGITVYEINNIATYRGTLSRKVLKNEFDLLGRTHRDSFMYGFSQQEPIVLALPAVLREAVIPFYKEDAIPSIPPVEAFEPTDFVFKDSERDILLEWPRIMAYFKQGQMNYTVKDRPSATGLPKIQRSLGLREFFPDGDKKLRTLRTALLAGMAVHFRFYPLKGQVSDQIYTLFRNILPQKGRTAPLLLPDIKGTAQVENESITPDGHIYETLLQALPQDSWTSIEHIRQYARQHFLELRPFEYWIAQRHLYAEYHDPDKPSYYGDKHPIRREMYRQWIELPMLNGIFFLFAAFGLCELAFDAPEEVDFRHYYSSWDGLRYVRRTRLGDFVSGQTLHYDASQIQPAHRLVLSPETLMITAEGGAGGIGALLEPYAEPIGPTRFRTDSQLFLKNIRSKKELESKIELFKQLVGDALPDNWSVFLQDLLQKINPLEPVEDMLIWRIPENNKALIQLMAKDPKLKSLVVKAEGYIVLIPKKKYAAVKTRLQEFGYLLTAL